MRLVVLAFVLMSVLSALTASNSLLHGTVLSVAAQTGPASSNTTVSNNVSVLSDSVSLGSSLHVEGVVTTPNAPLASVPVTLHMGDITVARTQTDASGKYAFSAPVGLNYVPAVFSGSANVYTVAEPTDTAFPAAPSAVASLPVDASPAYGIVAGVTGIVVLGLYVYSRAGTAGRQHIRPRLAALPLSSSTYGSLNIRPRLAALPLSSSTYGSLNIRPRLAALRLPSWTRRHARRENERIEAVAQPAPESEPPVDLAASSATESAEELPQQAPVAEHAPAASDTVVAPGERTEAATQPALESEPASEEAQETSAVRRARDLFAEGRDRQAVGLLYDAASDSLVKASTVTLLPSMTHWEQYRALEAAIPKVREPLRTLTVAFERTHYGGKSLTEDQQNAVIAAFQSISALAEPVEENT